MNDYLDKFKTLPKELQDAVTSDEKVKILEEIEKKYNLKLAKLVVRIMIKDILWSDLENFLITDFKLTPEKAKELKKDLKEKIFDEVLEYLEIKKQGGIDEVVKEIKQKLNLVFEDEILERRFENIIKSYLKEIRNEAQTEEVLSRAKKIGGMEFPSEKINEIMKILKELKGSLFSSETEKNLKNEEFPVQIKRPIGEEKLVEDITIKPKAIGPIEELSEITLIDLQRWGGGEKTCQIIFDKINLLAEESLFKKSEGINAWQRSPLYRLYLEIGQEALDKKKSLAEIIQERKINGKPILEINDWEAINELNRKLHF